LLFLHRKLPLDIIAVRADEQFNYQAMQTYLQTYVAHAEGPLER